jgi:hypothetical protein
VSKKGAVAGKFDEKTYQKNKEEKEKRKERENFRHRKQIVLDNADTLYKRFIDIYGPDGKMPRGIGYESPEEYDNIMDNLSALSQQYDMVKPVSDNFW